MIGSFRWMQPYQVGPDILADTFGIMMIDEEWSVRSSRSFTWWGHLLAQTVSATEPIESRGVEVTVMSAVTDVARDVDPDLAIEAASAFNKGAGMSAVVVDTDARTLTMACSMVLHPANLFYRKFFSVAVAYQAAEAHLYAETLAHVTGGEIAVSSHPSSGPRPAPDDMLNVMRTMPGRDDPVPFTARDFRTAAETTLEPIGESPFVEANSDDHGLTAEFPFDSGSSLLLIREVDPETAALDVSNAEMIQRYPILDRSTQATARYGSGLSIKLGIPVDPSLVNAGIANYLNGLEAAGISMTQFLGAWYVDESGLWYTGYLPNLLMIPLQPDDRPVTLFNLAVIEGARSNWVHSLLIDGSPPSGD